MGERGGKSDMERIGLFQEMNYTTIGDRFKPSNSSSFNEAAAKGKQMLPGGSKTRSSLQAGYFNDRYGRILEGEAYTDPIKMRRQNRLKEAQKNIGKPFLPSSGDKRQSGLGNHYGTLSGPIPAFSAVNRGRKAEKAPGRNFLTNPGKVGTGYGYLHVTIGDYNKHQHTNYERNKEIDKKEIEMHRKALKGGAFRLNMSARQYFDDNPYRSDRPLPPVKRSAPRREDLKPFKPSSPPKRPAGSKAGTFDAYPAHSVDPYKKPKSRPVHVVNTTGKTFMPSMGPKSAPTSSVVNQNVIKTINSQNYKTITSVSAF